MSVQLLREQNTSWTLHAREEPDRTRVPISLLGQADTPRHSGVDAEHVSVLTGVEDLPPILVHRRTMRVIDGAHRVQAALARGEDVIEVVFFEGDEAEAFVLAVESNVGHGLPLTLAERRTAAARIVRAYPDWSDRRIAAVAGISPKTAGTVRARSSTEEIPQSRTRVGLDGRTRRVSPRAEPEPEETKAPVPPQAKPPIDQTSKHRAAIYTLRRDPSLRFSESGRTLLRMLDLHSVPSPAWGDISDAVPAYCAPLVADLARECAEAWLLFADGLDEKPV